MAPDAGRRSGGYDRRSATKSALNDADFRTAGSAGNRDFILRERPPGEMNRGCALRREHILDRGSARFEETRPSGWIWRKRNFYSAGFLNLRTRRGSRDDPSCLRRDFAAPGNKKHHEEFGSIANCCVGRVARRAQTKERDQQTGQEGQAPQGQPPFS